MRNDIVMRAKNLTHPSKAPDVKAERETAETHRQTPLRTMLQTEL